MGRPASVAGIIIVALMIAGAIPVEVDNAWLWALLALFAVALLLPDRPSRPRRRG